ncbi:MAG TPA: DUF2322 family protein [Thiobacillaceae bacterium]|nr:DUF2322 family protein [Thiobacillaceae bacterium]HNH89888.1 DUF2322 family protein [Thiobacillaceae bacterium]HNI07749.1 DUF2322 family protein [Thiobacillaceae bacterium]
MMGFQENLAGLAPADHLDRIELEGPPGLAGVIENKPGSQGSLRVYQHLVLKHGCLDPAAAEEGLALYAEHAADALAHPGKHPNIDRLLEIRARGLVLAPHLIAANP